MPDAEDAHSIVVEGEQHAVVAQTEPEGAGHIAVESIHVAAAGACKAENALEDAHSCRLVQATDVGLGFVEPVNPVGRHYLCVGNLRA